MKLMPDAVTNRIGYFEQDYDALQKNGYTLKKCIGEGSYSKVRVARYSCSSGTQLLACKMLKMEKCTGGMEGNPFVRRELEIIPTLQHPNLIRIHSIIAVSDRLYIFMEYAENGDLLTHLLKEGHLKEPKTRAWFRQMASGLKYLHVRNLAHRDLKCENILITKHFNVKIGDFGFARSVVDKDGRRLLSHTYCGSTGYIAPEVLRKQPYNPQMADVWSLGVILYIMMNACMPFDERKGQLLKNQMNREWKHRSHVKREFSPMLIELVSRLLEPHVHQRITLKEVCVHPWVANQQNTPPKLSSDAQCSSNADVNLATAASRVVSLHPSAGGDTCAPLGRSLRVDEHGVCQASRERVTVPTGDGEKNRSDFGFSKGDVIEESIKEAVTPCENSPE